LPPGADEAQTAAILTAALAGGVESSATLQHAGAVLRRYSWDDAAVRTLACIERILRRP
jgi:hypothetical protein